MDARHLRRERKRTIYIGTSNAAPDYCYTRAGEGDNKCSTLLAIDRRPSSSSGIVRSRDTWDFDSACRPAGQERMAKDVNVAHLNRAASCFVMDKKDGALENVWQFAENMNWTKGIDRRRVVVRPH